MDELIRYIQRRLDTLDREITEKTQEYQELSQILLGRQIRNEQNHIDGTTDEGSRG